MTSLREQALALTALRYKLVPTLMRQLQVKESCLGELLQCHLFTEHLLEELITLALGSSAEAISSARLTYDQKLHVASRLTVGGEMKLLQDYVVGSLRNLNALRNRLAHRYDAEVTSADIEQLFVGLERELPYAAVSECRNRTALSRYAAFIFGSMLPKYETLGPAEA